MQNLQKGTFANLILHNDFVNAIGLFKTTIINYRQILTSLDRGYIDEDLIPAKILQDALVQVKDKIPGGFKLIYDPARTSLRPYYTLKLASRIVGSQQICGLLQIPLTGMADDFILYKSIPFPSRLTEKSEPMRRFMLKDVNRYIALSTDRRRFMDLGSDFNPETCLAGELLICPTQAAVMNNPLTHCIFQIISGSLRMGESQTRCVLTEIASEDIYIQAIDSVQWAVSSPKTASVRASCLDLNSTIPQPRNFASRELRGNHILTIPRRCEVDIDHQSIPMRLLMTSDLGKLPGRLSIPPIHGHSLLNLHGAQILDEKLDKEFHSSFQDILELYHDRSIEPNASAAEVGKLMLKIMKEAQDITKIQPSFHTSSWYGWLNGFFWCLLFCVIIAVVCWVRGRPQETQTVTVVERELRATGDPFPDTRV